MLKIFIIIFREILEIAIILGLIAAATKNVKGRFAYIGVGVIVGLVGASLLALFANKISDMFEGYGQELINAIILLVACGMIIWTVVWMKQTSQKISAKIKSYGEQLSLNNASLMPLSIITASAIFREGGEIILFSYGVIKSTQEPLLNLAIAGALGLLAASTIGILLYIGIIKLSGKYLFKVTSVLLSLIAAGMAAQAASFLSASGAITILQDQLWDSSSVISQSNTFGRIMNILVGYIERPTAIELLFYGATLFLIVFLSLRARKV